MRALSLGDGSDLIGFSPEPESLKSYFEARRALYETQAGRTDFGLGFRDKTCFDHSTNEIIVGLKQLLDLGLITSQEFDFGIYHELKHYEDFKGDPKNYEEFIKKAEGPLGGLYFRLYNCTEDIAVNTRVAYDSPHYRGEDTFFSALVREMYRDKLFAGRDFTDRPLCVQFSDYILNLGMEVGDDIVVDERVRKELDEPIEIYGKKFSLKEFIDEYLKPKVGESVSVQKRLEAVDKYLLPRFERLLEIDINERSDLEEQSKSGLGEPVPGSGGFKDYKKAVEAIKKIKDEESLSPSERGKKRQEEQIKQIAKDSGLTKEQGEEFIRVFNRVSNVIQSLVELWTSIPQKTTNTSQKRVGHFRSGFTLDIREAIRNFPEIWRSPETAEVMLRKEEQTTVDYAPKKFRLRLVVDVSGSMQHKMQLVGELSVALTGSMIRVNSENNYHGRDFHCELEVYTFGSKSHEILKSDKSLSLRDIMKAYKRFFEFEDSTNEHLGLNRVKDSVVQSENEERVNGELFDLVICITDGDTADPGKSISAIKKIEKSGVVCRAVRLGSGSQFGQIWNHDGVKRGEEIQDFRNLGSVIRKLIEDELNRLNR